MVESYNKGQKVKCNQIMITFLEKYFMRTSPALSDAKPSPSLPSVNMVDQERHLSQKGVTLFNEGLQEQMQRFQGR